MLVLEPELVMMVLVLVPKALELTITKSKIVEEKMKKETALAKTMLMLAKTMLEMQALELVQPPHQQRWTQEFIVLMRMTMLDGNKFQPFS